jgi:PAS domain S-box-containing protein
VSATDTASILLVDDRRENLLALEAALEPLQQQLVSVQSGESALRELLYHDFACILLDVQMPDLDGFETAELIKQRPRTATIPIIFVTAISKDERHVFRGYSAGAVDYILKPVDPDVLRSKVSVFIELWQKSERLKQHERSLREQEVGTVRRESEERYRRLADAMPQIVWATDAHGNATYFNERWFEYTGMPREQADATAWTRVCHPDDLPHALARRTETLETGEVFEVEYRFRAGDGSYRWHLGRAIPIVGESGEIEVWIGTATDIDDRKRVEEAQRFLLDAGAELASSLDYRKTLAAVARLAVPRIADWCTVDVVDADGSIRELAIEHVDPEKVLFARELQERYPPTLDAPASPAPHVIESGEPALVREITAEMVESAARDELHLDLIREMGFRSYMCVPLTARGRTLGAITLIASEESGRTFGDDDLRLAEELARRAATAIDNAHLYREAEERAQAARVLATIGDGVFLVDRDGIVRLWNPAAAAIFGLAERHVLGRRAADAIPAWQTLAARVPLSEAPGPSIADVPLEIGGRELWLSVSAVDFEDGRVYAFRDLTHERALEEMRQDLVATVSHELRTPLAAIYGSALTLRRTDVDLGEELHDKLLEVIVDESERLSVIVNDLLLASQLDSGNLQVNIVRCDPKELVDTVVEAARTHLPPGVRIEVESPERLPHVQADPEQLRQVLGNLVDNAVKYSPDGGPVTVRMQRSDAHLRFSISDRGLGIPTAEQRRIFEKFYRLDPQMTRGIGGTGLGLYICRELVRRVDGRIWVESQDGSGGSTFFVEIPLARAGKAQTPKRRQRAAA